jgi:hypothetical protein
MARNFLNGLGWMLIVTAILGLLASSAPDNKVAPAIAYSGLALRLAAAIVVFYFANKCVAAYSRLPAVGMWLLGFVVGFPLGNLAINGVVIAAWYALGSASADPMQLGGAKFDLPVPPAMCALSEQRHQDQLAFAHQLNPGQKLLLLIVPCDRLALYEPGSSASADTSLLFDTAEWAAVLDSKRDLLKASNTTISSVKAGMQEGLQALNAARASGQRYPATGPELRNVTIVGEGRDRIFSTSIKRFQRPFDPGPLDQYGASGFIIVARYIFKFSIFSYVKNENDLLAIAEKTVGALGDNVGR